MLLVYPIIIRCLFYLKWKTFTIFLSRDADFPCRKRKLKKTRRMTPLTWILKWQILKRSVCFLNISFVWSFLVSTISSSGLLNMFFTFYPRILNCSNSVVIEYIKCKSHVNVTLNSFYFLLKKSLKNHSTMCWKVN